MLNIVSMSLNLHHSHSLDLDESKLPLYFRSKYGTIQDYQNPVIVEEPELFFLKGDVHGKTFHSLPRSPFGGIIISENLTRKNFRDLIEEMKERLTNDGIEKLTIINAPEIYSGITPGHWMENSGFEKNYSEINQHILLNKNNVFHPMENRRINKARKAGMKFQKLSTDKMPQLYDFLEKARQQQGLKINITRDRFIRMVSTLKKYYKGYGVFFENKMVAGLLTADVTENITYYFLPGSNREFNNFSPMALLISELLIKLKQENKSILDMGISSIKGELQEGLFIFKKRMGAIALEKPTFEMSL